MPASLDVALNPASVAIIGASDNPHKVGGRPLLYLQRYGYRGAIYPINPARATVQGVRALPRIEDTPQPPDLAIIAIAGNGELTRKQRTIICSDPRGPGARL